MVKVQRPSAWLTFIFLLWFALNIAINMYNRWLLGKTGFKFPMLLTSTNKFIGWIGSIIVLLVSKYALGSDKFPTPQQLLVQFKRPMVHLHGVLTATNIGFNNWSLVFISISLNQLIKSTVPLPTAALSVVVEKKTFGWQVWASNAVIVLGTALSSWGSMEKNDVEGILLCIVSVLSAAGWTVLSAVLLQHGGQPLDAVGITFVSSPTCILTTMTFHFAIEFAKLQAWLGDPAEQPMSGGTMVLLMLVGGLLGFSYDLVHNQYVKMTSAVTMAVAGNAKLVVLVVISYLTFEKPPSLLGVIGITIGLLGCFWYSFYKHMDGVRKKKAAEAAKAAAAPAASEHTILINK